jgi:hypothetical protein
VDEGAVYSQLTEITVGSASIDGVTITFSGVGFPTSDFIAIATINGIEAYLTTIEDETTVIASWDHTGIPASAALKPSIEFIRSDMAFSMFAVITQDVQLMKELTVTSTSDNFGCSFAGGCTYAIAGDGVYATLLD